MILDSDPLRSRLRITSANLILVPIDGALVRAYIDGPENFAAALNASIPSDWDIAQNFTGGHLYADALERQPELYGKSAWYAMRMEDRRLVGLFQVYFDPTDPTTTYFGYEIAPSERRKGYATEGAKALIDWLFTDPEVTRVSAECDHDNPASLKVLQKAGMKRLPVNGDAIIRLELVNPDASPTVSKTYPNILLDLCPFRYHSQENQSRVFKWTYNRHKRSIFLLGSSCVLILVSRPEMASLVAVAVLFAVLYLCYEWLMNLTKSPTFAPFLTAVHRPQLRSNGLYWSSSATSGAFYPWPDILSAQDRGDEIWLLLKGKHTVKLPQEAFELEGIREEAIKIITNAGVPFN